MPGRAKVVAADTMLLPSASVSSLKATTRYSTPMATLPRASSPIAPLQPRNSAPPVLAASTAAKRSSVVHGLMPLWVNSKTSPSTLPTSLHSEVHEPDGQPIAAQESWSSVMTLRASMR